MINFFYELNPLIQAIIASLFTFSLTTIGAAMVFLFKKVNKNVMDSMLALSAGIMLSAAFFSLLLPAIEQARDLKTNVPLIVTMSILGGALLLIIGDRIASKHTSNESKITRSFLLITSITIHNIPEGMAIGCAFASVAFNIPGATLIGAISLALGIGLQNMPEGAAISLPLRRDGMSRLKSFILGTLSGIVEPISAIIGVLLVLKVKFILPYLLAFAAGAMLFVVIIELIPESMQNKHKHLMGILSLVGFIIMMIMEIM